MPHSLPRYLVLDHWISGVKLVGAGEQFPKRSCPCRLPTLNVKTAPVVFIYAQPPLLEGRDRTVGWWRLTAFRSATFPRYTWTPSSVRLTLRRLPAIPVDYRITVTTLVTAGRPDAFPGLYLVD